MALRLFRDIVALDGLFLGYVGSQKKKGPKSRKEGQKPHEEILASRPINQPIYGMGGVDAGF